MNPAPTVSHGRILFQANLPADYIDSVGYPLGRPVWRICGSSVIVLSRRSPKRFLRIVADARSATLSYRPARSFDLTKEMLR